MSYSLTALAVLIPAVILYIHRLSERSKGPHPLTDSAKPDLDPEILDTVSRYDHINVLDGIPKVKTGKGYAIVGGSGFVGEYVSLLLLLRGETHVRILDIDPIVSPRLLAYPHVDFVRTDITSLESVRNGLSTPFADGTRVEVIYSVAAVIRFWERLNYQWDASYQVNVRGTQNVVIVAQELQAAKGNDEDPVIVLFTSSTDAGVIQANPLFLAWGPPNVLKDENPDIPASRADRWYMRSKLEAESIVKKAHTKGSSGLKTGIIRPGCIISGPGDITVSILLSMARSPTFDGNWSTTNVCVWDVASAHILLEDALRREAALERHSPGAVKEKIGGTTFFISGPDKPWKAKDYRNAIKHFSRGQVQIDEVNTLLMLVIAYLVEAFLYLRYHILLPFFYIYGFAHASPSPKPSLAPKWLGSARFMQPATLKHYVDITVDHSRAGRLLGYKPLWRTEQYTRWSVDGTKETMAKSGKTAANRYL